MKESQQACGTPEAADRYWQTQGSAAVLVADGKTLVWEEFGDSWLPSKQFQQTVRQLSRGKQYSKHTVYSGADLDRGFSQVVEGTC